MTKLEEAELWIRDGSSFMNAESRKLIADELARLRAEVADKEQKLVSMRSTLCDAAQICMYACHGAVHGESAFKAASRYVKKLEAEVADLRGERHMIRYVQSESPYLALDDTLDGESFERRVDAEHPTGTPIYEIRLSARKAR